MAQSLSAAARSEIEHVTRLCQRLDFFIHCPPLTVRALSQGDSNQSYYVHTAQGDYVLRCYPEHSAVCRQQELRCQHAAAAKGLAPAPLCLNNHFQVLLTDYVADGCQYPYATLGVLPLLEKLVPFHQLAVQAPLLDCTGYLQQQWQAVVASDAEHALYRRALNSAAALERQPVDEVLCHLDLHCGNILWAANRTWLLDFEYSQRADSSLDLAALCIHFNLDPTQQNQLLQQYAKLRQRSELVAQLQLKLTDAKIVYAAFCWLWYLAQPGCQTQAAVWQQQLQQL